ncbi:MAG: ABC transporter permease [Candidatus Kapaibacterium sp.]|nr:ABC transporter permease [Bacteroidota bacterium]
MMKKAQSGLRPLFIVARWEFLQRLRNPFQIVVFVLSTLLTSFVVLQQFNKQDSSGEHSTWIGIDCTNQPALLVPILSAFQESFQLPNGNPKYILLPRSPNEDFDTSALAGAIVINTTSTGTYFLQLTVFNENERLDIQSARYVIENVLHNQVNPDNVQTVLQSLPFQKQSSNNTALNLAFALIVFTVSMGSGQLLMRSFLEERYTALYDVMVTSTSPTAYLFGKYCGSVLFGTLQILLWLGVITVMLLQVIHQTISFNLLVLTALCAVGSLSVNLILFLVAGILVRKETSANAVAYFLSLFMLLPFAFGQLLQSSHLSGMVQSLAYFPLYSAQILYLTAVNAKHTLNIYPQLAAFLSSYCLMLYLAYRVFQTRRFKT